MAEEVKYEFKSAKAIRGMEGRIAARLESDGWELVDKTQATFHTTLNFRRVKPPLPWLKIAASAGAALVLASIIGIGALLGGGDDNAHDSANLTTIESDSSKATAPDRDTGEPAPTAPRPTYSYQGPTYEIVAIDRDVSNKHLNEFWVYTEPLDYSNSAFRAQVKAIITDVAREQGTDKLIVDVVTHKDVALAEAASTYETFVVERGLDYAIKTIPQMEKTHYVAQYRGGFDPEAGPVGAGGSSNSSDAFELMWFAEGIEGSEKWRPER